MRTDEQALFAALLVKPDSVLELEIAADDFSTADGAQLFAAMQAVASRGAQVDGPTLGQELGDYRLVGQAMQAQGSPTNIAHYVGSIKKASRLRRIQSLCDEISKAANGNEADPDSLTDRVIADLSESGSSGKNAWTMSEVMGDSLKAVSDAKETRRQGGTVGVSTGFRMLDRVLGGLRDGRLYVCGARPKMGKTSWALALQANAARAGYRVGFASSEMAAQECGLRWLSAASGVPATSIQTGELSDSDESRVAKASNLLSQYPIQIFDQAGVTPSRIRRQCLAWQRRYGLDLLIVDYLQRLKPDDSGERRDLTVGEMTRAFKTAARDLNIPVVLLVQLSRGVDQRDDKRPLPTDMRDSGEIEQEADVVSFIYRDSVYNEVADPNEAEFLIRMNRHGETGRVRLHFDPKYQRWLDFDIAESGWEAA